MSKRFLDPDNGLMITLAQIGDCFYLSLFWILGCFPIVTVGASSAALYDACYHSFRKGEKTSWQQFLKTYKENWKTGIVPSLIYLILFFGMGKGMIGIWNRVAVGEGSWAVFAGCGVAAVLVLGMLSILFPMLSRFDNSTGALLKNTVLLAMAHLPRTVGLGMITAGSMALCARLIFPVVFMPALTALIGSLYIEPMFKPYLPEETEETEENEEMPLE